MTQFNLRLRWLEAKSVLVAFLRQLRFRMGIVWVSRWNGLEMLIPKHRWKSKIRLLEEKLDTNRYVAFFLVHPVWYWFFWFLYWIGPNFADQVPFQLLHSELWVRKDLEDFNKTSDQLARWAETQMLNIFVSNCKVYLSQISKCICPKKISAKHPINLQDGPKCKIYTGTQMLNTFVSNCKVYLSQISKCICPKKILTIHPINLQNGPECKIYAGT